MQKLTEFYWFIISGGKTVNGHSHHIDREVLWKDAKKKSLLQRKVGTSDYVIVMVSLFLLSNNAITIATIITMTDMHCKFVCARHVVKEFRRVTFSCFSASCVENMKVVDTENYYLCLT